MRTWEWEPGNGSLEMGAWEREPGNESLGMGTWGMRTLTSLHVIGSPRPLPLCLQPAKTVDHRSPGTKLLKLLCHRSLHRLL